MRLAVSKFELLTVHLFFFTKSYLSDCIMTELTSSDGDLWPYCIISAVAIDRYISPLGEFLDCG